MTIALDATYSIGEHLSGVGIYSNQILNGLAAAHPEAHFRFCYRGHVYWRSRAVSHPPNARRMLLAEPFGPRRADLFHGLNQRLPRVHMRRSVVTFHDLFVMTGEYSTPEFRARFTEQAREAASRADAIIAVSEFTRAQVISLLGVDPAKVHVVHHGVAEGLSSEERDLEVPPRPGDLPHDEPVILTVGAIQKRKNVARLVEAFEGVDDSWRLVIAGSQGYASTEILVRIAQSPARDRILLPGYVSAADLAGWYARASVFAFPSLDEGFGMPVLEAMAAGIPVLTSSGSALPEIAGDAALLIDPADTQKMAHALRRLTEDSELRQTLAARGRERAKLFTWQKAVRETWNIYRILLA